MLPSFKTHAYNAILVCGILDLQSARLADIVRLLLLLHYYDVCSFIVLY